MNADVAARGVIRADAMKALVRLGQLLAERRRDRVRYSCELDRIERIAIALVQFHFLSIDAEHVITIRRLRDAQ